MKQNHKKINYGYYAALVVGIVALVVLVGVYTTRQNIDEKDQYVDLSSGNESLAEQSGEESTASVGASVADASNSDMTDASNSDVTDSSDSGVADADSTNTDNIGKADLAKADTQTSETVETETTQEEKDTGENSEDASETAASVAFSSDARLSWPVQGSVILPYSMDTTVYYKTIDAYKCSSGMLIQTKAGTSVYSAYGGTVKEVYSSNEYGKMVSVDIGGGYTAIYGQLADVQVTQGQQLSQGTAIATVAEPTNLFRVEGANLYFALQKDGEYVNPENYLQ
ncbi:MAG: M23 family metallopeptidase [Lachnospiraceae bacterium]|nr:M23 family metallopeptidase [Lachnospiraceae bacterium]